MALRSRLYLRSLALHRAHVGADAERRIRPPQHPSHRAPLLHAHPTQYARVTPSPSVLTPNPSHPSPTSTTNLLPTAKHHHHHPTRPSPGPLLTPLLCAGSGACALGVSFGGSFTRSAASARRIGDGGGYLVCFAAVACVAVSLAVFACSAALGLGPDVALRNSAAVSAVLALPMAAVGAWARV